jgi:S1-C subfamily serine protease/cytochrome c-type biogenesis protein CcmH/NrfG
MVFALVGSVGLLLWLARGKEAPAGRPAGTLAPLTKAAPDSPAAGRAEPGVPPLQERLWPKPTLARSGEPLSAEALFKQASPAVVRIDVRDGDSDRGFGSGFLISEDGLVATNYHVIRGVFQARAVFGDGATNEVMGVAATDPMSDLALLKIEGPPFFYLELAGSELPPVGSRVFAIGSPTGLTNSLSEGLISGHRLIGDSGTRMIQTTAAISPGSSGGPLLGADGQVLGVTTAIRRGGQNLNWAVPAEALARLLRARGPVQPLSGAGAQPLPSEENAQGLKEVWEAINTRDYAEALRLLHALPASQKASPKYWFAFGFVQGWLGNHQLAVDAWQTAIRLGGSDATVFYNLGISWFRLRRWQEAAGAFRSAVARKPDFANAYLYLGNTFGYLGEYSSAISSFRSVITLQPDRADAHSMLGQALFFANRHEEAIEALRTAIKLGDDSVATHFTMGVALQTRRFHRDAIQAFNAVVRLNSNYAPAHLRLGQLHFEIAKTYSRPFTSAAVARYGKAVYHLRRGAALDPNGKIGTDAKALLAAVDVLWQSGNL